MSLYTLQDKLGLLIKAYKDLKDRELLLQKKVSSLASRVYSLEQNVQELEAALLIKQMSQSDDQSELKQYIDSIIEEIELTIKKL
ncbi:MAG: hypothetical protein EOP54_12230 [Sphingobacteriales bacterium]|nr:MAG: hypothetical protein EOP54_12230 [Sphingobacteriales bacterium]